MYYFSTKKQKKIKFCLQIEFLEIAIKINLKLTTVQLTKWFQIENKLKNVQNAMKTQINYRIV